MSPFRRESHLGSMGATAPNRGIYMVPRSSREFGTSRAFSLLLLFGAGADDEAGTAKRRSHEAMALAGSSRGRWDVGGGTLRLRRPIGLGPGRRRERVGERRW